MIDFGLHRHDAYQLHIQFGAILFDVDVRGMF